MQFNRYQHIERLGTDEVEGILDGICHVFPKIDGANGSVWMDADENIQCGSRNRQLDENEQCQGFWGWVQENRENFKGFFRDWPNMRLYGEWLVPHSLLTYRDEAWRKFYVFDVVREYDMDTGKDDGSYMDYDEYSEVMRKHGIPFIPELACVSFPTQEKLIGLLDKNTYLIKDGMGVGEGLVIKRYDFRNRFGHVKWAKMVRNEFKEKNREAFWSRNMRPEESGTIEDRIVAQYVTKDYVDKLKAKITNECGGWRSELIGRLLGQGYNELLTEEICHMVKKFKAPTIDFGRLNKLATHRIKELAGV